MKIVIYTKDQLAPIVEDGSKGFANKNQWVNQFLAGAAELVKKNPSAYLSFGPFWWPLKDMMQKTGVLDVKPVDPDLVAQVSMGDAALDCAAAFAFQEHYAGGNEFTVETEDGETMDYVLVDEEMAG